MTNRHIVIAAGILAAAFHAGAARAEIVIHGTVTDHVLSHDTKAQCEDEGGVWVVVSPGVAYCDMSQGAGLSDNLRFPWVARAEATRRHFTRLAAAPQLAATPLLKATGEWIALADKLLGLWSKSNHDDSLKGDVASLKRVAERQKAIDAWSSVRADLVKLEVVVSRKLAELRARR